MQVKCRDSEAVCLALKFYQSLVRLYPPAFRDAYGALMVQAFRDSYLRESREGSPAGLLWLWARTFGDVLLSVMEQYANRGASMTKSKWIRLSGWSLVASSFTFLAGWAASTRPPYNEFNYESWPIDRYLNAAGTPLLFLGMLFTAIGILGLQAHFGRQAGGLGKAGLSLSLMGAAATLAGIVGLSLQDSSPWWETAMLGMTALFVGLGLFGIACIKRNMLGHWNSLPLLIGLPWPLLVLANLTLNSMNSVEFEMPWEIIAVMFVISFTGLGLIGYLLQSEAQGSEIARA